jgi:hypothetical protein
MIYYVSTKDFANTMYSFLGTWGKELRNVIKPVSYEKMFRKRSFPPGNYIFSDIERLSIKDTERAAQIHKILLGSNTGCSLFNNPTQSMKRFELLRSLHQENINKHNVFHVIGNEEEPRKFPVFLRVADDHGGSISPLLHSKEELRLFLDTMAQHGLSKEGKIIVEFCDCSDSKGIYRKYSCFFIAGQVIPRHICFGKNWVVKEPDIIQPEHIEEERDFLQNNPHEQTIRSIFNKARIDYGRIDYGVLDDKPQVWEINTNPRLASVISSITPERDKNTQLFVEQLVQGFLSINLEVSSQKEIKSGLRKEIQKERISKVVKRVVEPMIFSLPMTNKWKIGLLNSLINVKHKYKIKQPSLQIVREE